MAAESTAAENIGMFVCSCLWSGKLSFEPDEIAALKGDLKAYKAPCPECGRNTLDLKDDTPTVEHDPLDDIDLSGRTYDFSTDDDEDDDG